MLNLFEHVQYPNFFSVHFRPYATSFPRLLLFLMFMSKGKKTLATGWSLRLRSRPLLMQRFRVWFWMWIIWKIGIIILFKLNMAEKDACRTHKFRSLDCNFFVPTFTQLMISEGKKRINKALSKQSKQFFLLFLFFDFKDWVSNLNLKFS